MSLCGVLFLKGLFESVFLVYVIWMWSTEICLLCIVYIMMRLAWFHCCSNVDHFNSLSMFVTLLVIFNIQLYVFFLPLGPWLNTAWVRTEVLYATFLVVCSAFDILSKESQTAFVFVWGSNYVRWPVQISPNEIYFSVSVFLCVFWELPLTILFLFFKIVLVFLKTLC